MLETTDVTLNTDQPVFMETVRSDGEGLHWHRLAAGGYWDSETGSGTV